MGLKRLTGLKLLRWQLPRVVGGCPGTRAGWAARWPGRELDAVAGAGGERGGARVGGAGGWGY
jgi:hypothetical protein